MTARMVSITSIGGSPGARPKTNTSRNRPDPTDEAEADAAVVGADEQAAEHDHELKDDKQGFHLVPPKQWGWTPTSGFTLGAGAGRRGETRTPGTDRYPVVAVRR